MDNIPEKFLNQDGTLNSESLIKSYTELEKKIGTMISVPNENLIVQLVFQKVHPSIQKTIYMMMKIYVNNFYKLD